EGRQEVARQEGDQVGHAEGREEDRQEGGEEARAAQGQGAGRRGRRGTDAAAVSNPVDVDPTPLPQPRRGWGFSSGPRGHSGPAVDAPDPPAPPDDSPEAHWMVGAGRRSALASITSISSRSTSSQAWGVSPMALSRIVGTSPVGRLLSPFQSSTTPRSRSGITAIAPR